MISLTLDSNYPNPDYLSIIFYNFCYKGPKDFQLMELNSHEKYIKNIPNTI